MDLDVFRTIGISNIKKYGFTDFLILCSIFVLGILFSWALGIMRRD